MNVLESETTVLDTKLVFINLYTSVASLRRDFDNPALLELFEGQIRQTLADVLTEWRVPTRTLKVNEEEENDEMEEPPIDPDDFQLITHSTDGVPHKIRADYLLRVEGMDVQSARDRSAQMEVRRRLLELVRAIGDKTVEVRFV